MYACRTAKANGLLKSSRFGLGVCCWCKRPNLFRKSTRVYGKRDAEEKETEGHTFRHGFVFVGPVVICEQKLVQFHTRLELCLSKSREHHPATRQTSSTNLEQVAFVQEDNEVNVLK